MGVRPWLGSYSVPLGQSCTEVAGPVLGTLRRILPVVEPLCGSVISTVYACSQCVLSNFDINFDINFELD